MTNGMSEGQRELSHMLATCAWMLSRCHDNCNLMQNKMNQQDKESIEN